MNDDINTRRREKYQRLPDFQLQERARNKHARRLNRFVKIDPNTGQLSVTGRLAAQTLGVSYTQLLRLEQDGIIPALDRGTGGQDRRMSCDQLLWLALVLAGSMKPGASTSKQLAHAFDLEQVKHVIAMFWNQPFPKGNPRFDALVDSAIDALALREIRANNALELARLQRRQAQLPLQPPA